MAIYTKTGDDGTTAVFGGKRVLKSDPQVEAYGSIDELNSFCGLVLSHLPPRDPMTDFFILVQSDLMHIGSVLAGWEQDISFINDRVRKMEIYMNTYGKQLPPLHQFILPGGSIVASYLHCMRSICRRTERVIVQIVRNHVQYKTIVRYLNRLSDLCFVYARYINSKEGIKEITWKVAPSHKGSRKVV